MENFGQYNGSQNASSPENYKLKWHKFLIYFALWASAVVNVGTAIMCIDGTINIYDGQNELIVSNYSRLRTVLLIRGLVLLAIVAYTIYTRFQLAGFRVNAPRKLSIFYGLNLAASLLYLLAISSITHMTISSLVGEIVMQIFINILMIFINQNYYSKRLELFVN